jgi:hypothetical protein
VALNSVISGTTLGRSGGEGVDTEPDHFTLEEKREAARPLATGGWGVRRDLAAIERWEAPIGLVSRSARKVQTKALRTRYMAERSRIFAGASFGFVNDAGGKQPTSTLG